MLSDVPIFHILTRKKNVSVYAKVFGVVKQELQALRVDKTTLRIILDFEKAALEGIKVATATLVTFKNFSHHLTYRDTSLWNAWRVAASTSHKLGKSTFSRHKVVRKWWMTIEGLMFLPPHLHRKVPALHRPSVPRSHHSYLRCEKFLAYLHKTWYNGPFKEIWNKWDKKELRTSNVAETSHK
ncbi:hypothetical protein ANCDUO_14300 [Ancylostoma duodenale]|uniref:MULE transposase domain-containing protein n=1 Tax=Ancylostoma duodenale TaxID=51022 RepID=A0A0C2GEL5_9BILA|nr:hypothetical protein ANCDUO_14300 [Ancylostoma duodenale]